MIFFQLLNVYETKNNKNDHHKKSVIFFFDNSNLVCHENQTRNLESVWKFFLSKDLMMGHENLRKNFAPRGSGHFWNFSEYIQMHQKGEYIYI